MNTATGCTGTPQARLLPARLAVLEETSGKSVTVSVNTLVDIDGVGTKDLNKYVVDIIYYSYLLGLGA
jgi:hypothetical protein